MPMPKRQLCKPGGSIGEQSERGALPFALPVSVLYVGDTLPIVGLWALGFRLAPDDDTIYTYLKWDLVDGHFSAPRQPDTPSTKRLGV